MNSKKAKALRKNARQLVESAKRPTYEIEMWYKQMKKAYRFASTHKPNNTYAPKKEN